MGLTGLFLSALLSATILPGSSEVVLIGLVTAYPDQAWPAFVAALAGNLVGCVITYLMGVASVKGYERFRHVEVNQEGPQVRRLRRWGPPALLLAFLPLVGDALVLAAGWLRLDPWRSFFFIAVGKALRYLILVLGLKGLFVLM